MKKIIFVVVLFFSSFITMQAGDVIALEHWKFSLSDAKETAAVGFDDSLWEQVRVPHDWAINKSFDMQVDMQLVQVKEDGDQVAKLRTGRTGALPAFDIGWYRTTMKSGSVPKGKRVRIEFDGAMSLSKIYLNGKYIGEWPYGYSSFSFDLSGHWEYEKENTIAVRLENKPESSRWYSGAGLYRNVRLVLSNPVHIGHWGTTITTPKVSAKNGKVSVTTTIENHTGAVAKVKLLTSVVSKDGTVLKKNSISKKIEGNYTFEQLLDVKNPIFWDIENPHLYQIVSEVYVDGTLLDSQTTDFGFRTIRFDKDKGFFLNDKNVKLKGVCMHHDLGPLGAAVNYRALERQMQMMQEMGCNAIRTSHNPPTPELLELCDRMGLLVQVEAFDEWAVGKNKNGYNTLFEEWAEKDLEAMIRRDRNHPSIIMWSIGNEIREQGLAGGGEVAQMLSDICKREDPTRPTTAGFNNHTNAIKNGLADAIDLVGFNYKPRDYKKKHKENPDYVLYGSETASTVSSRGEYKFPATEKRGAYYDDYHVSSYDYEYPNWASTPDTEFEQQDDCEFIFGEFVWTGFDYLGEPTPYNEGTPARSSYFGIVDLVGMKKDRFYLYQSNWSDQKMLHLLPHWNWEDRMGQNVPVYCYTNYPKAELFVNGVSQGVKTKNRSSKYDRYRLMWKDVTYVPGEIKVVAYDENGKIAETKTIKTAGQSYQLRITPDRKEITADGKDLSYIEIEIVDKNGNLCPRADHMLFYEVKGNATFKAACNGDPTDQTSFSSPYMRAFNGKLMLIVESTEEAGMAEITVYGGRLKAGTQTIQTIQK